MRVSPPPPPPLPHKIIEVMEEGRDTKERTFVGRENKKVERRKRRKEGIRDIQQLFFVKLGQRSILRSA